MPVAKINGLNINYEDSGSGFPVVVAHGYCASTRMWDRLTPVLAERYRVIAYDARGHGLSSAPKGPEHYALDKLISDLHELLDQFEIANAHLIGHSMGGATVQGFAARHPNQAHATLICNIDGGYQPTDDEMSRDAADTRKRNQRLVSDLGIVEYARHQLETCAAPAFVRADPIERDAYLERYARQPLNGFFGVGEALPWRERWLAETVSALDGPVAVIAGTEDVMHEGAELLHRQLPGARFVSIRDAPHDSVNARPDAFNQAVLDFLMAVENGGEPGGRFTL